MASYKTGPFGRRLPTPAPEDVTVEEIFPPSREERMQTLWMYGTIVVGLGILGLGLLLRFTLFAKNYEPPHFTPTETSIASPSASPTMAATPEPEIATPAPTATPAPVRLAPAPVATPPEQQTSDGEPITPSLSETGGRPVAPK